MNNNSSKQVLLSVIGVAILVVAVVGVSFAFFNYSRTSTNTNTLTTGTIYFTSEDTGFRTGLNNAFPISATDAGNESCDTGTNVGCATVTIKGNTTYTGGIDFKVLLTGVNATNLTTDMKNALKFSVSTGTAVTGVTVTPSADFVDGSDLVNDTAIVTGHIDVTSAQVEQTITIKAYYDSSLIFISDTGTDSYTITRANGRPIVTTENWNNKAVSFGIRVVADQGGYTA